MYLCSSRDESLVIAHDDEMEIAERRARCSASIVDVLAGILDGGRIDPWILTNVKR